MKKSRFKETRIFSIRRQHEVGKSTKNICREHGINEPMFYDWKAYYGGMQVSDVKRMKDMEE